MTALRIARIEAQVYRAPIDNPVQTSFGVMRDRPAVLARMGGSIRLSDRPGLGLSDDWGAIAGLRRAHEY